MQVEDVEDKRRTAIVITREAFGGTSPLLPYRRGVIYFTRPRYMRTLADKVRGGPKAVPAPQLHLHLFSLRELRMRLLDLRATSCRLRLRVLFLSFLRAARK